MNTGLLVVTDADDVDGLLLSYCSYSVTLLSSSINAATQPRKLALVLSVERNVPKR